MENTGESVPLLNSDRTETKVHDSEETKKGLGLDRTVYLITSVLVGSGIISVPNVLKQAGWTGLVLMFTGFLVAGYCGILQGRCWSILQERYPEARVNVRRPYPMVAEKAVGKWMGALLTFFIAVGQLGVCMVVLLLTAQNLESLCLRYGVYISQCYWLLILSAIFIPLSWFDTPKDFWLIGVLSVLTALIVYICVVVALFGMIADGKRGIPETNPSARGVFLALGTILYNIAGGAVYPTIQHDMVNPAKFPLAIIYGFVVIIFFNCSVSILGYITFGRELEENILQNLPHETLRTVAEVAMIAHGMISVPIALNPVSQNLEGVMGIGEGFTKKKFFLRSGLILLALFVTETIPHFGAILDLVGATALTFVTIAPAIFYFCLCSQEGEWADRSLPVHIKVLCIELTLAGFFLGCAATYSAIVQIVDTGSKTFVPPCYVNVNVGPSTSPQGSTSHMIL